LGKEPGQSALEAELFKERAASLGIAGEKLQSAIEEYERSVRPAAGEADRRSDALLQTVADRAYELLVQRELNGLLHENVEWLTKAYRIPDPVLRMLGMEAKST
jgi:hypothetical protein